MAEDQKGAAAKLSEIFNGWKNVVFPNKHVEQIAKARASICAGCEFNVKNRDYKVVRGLKPNKYEIWIDGKIQEQLILLYLNIKQLKKVVKIQKLYNMV